jgi:hypothetical protein
VSLPWDDAPAEGQRREHQQQVHGEHRTPAGRADQQSTEGRTDCRRQPDRRTDHAEAARSPLVWHDLAEERVAVGQHDGAGDGLTDTAEDQER